MGFFEEKMLWAAVKVDCMVTNVRAKVEKKLREDTAEGYIDTLIKILISVILGVALLGVLKILIIDTFFPKLSTQINEMFDSIGSSGGTGGSGGGTGGGGATT